MARRSGPGNAAKDDRDGFPNGPFAVAARAVTGQGNVVRKTEAVKNGGDRPAADDVVRNFAARQTGDGSGRPKARAIPKIPTSGNELFSRVQATRTGGMKPQSGSY